MSGPDWKIERRKAACVACEREFDGEETHYSGIRETEEGFGRVDLCLACWEKKEVDLFSYWKTQTPPKVERKLENVQAMIDFFVRLSTESMEDPTRKKVVYLLSLLLMRRRKIKLLSTSKGKLLLEKAWDGDTVEIADPAIAENELEGLKDEMEKLFGVTEPSEG